MILLRRFFTSFLLHRRGVLNQVQLSVYPDGIGDNLSDLKTFLRKHIDGGSASEQCGRAGTLCLHRKA